MTFPYNLSGFPASPSGYSKKHPPQYVRDTAFYLPLRRDTGLHQEGAVSLKKVAKAVLQREIQEGSHSAKDDALATMVLYQSIAKEWERDVQLGKYLYVYQEGEKEKRKGRTLQILRYRFLLTMSITFILRPCYNYCITLVLECLTLHDVISSYDVVFKLIIEIGFSMIHHCMQMELSYSPPIKLLSLL